MCNSKKLNNLKKNPFDITVVGGGLTGSLMIYILLKSKICKKNKLCWINPAKSLQTDNRVSFYNANNLNKLINYGVFKKIPASDINKISEIQVLNEFQKNPLTWKETSGFGSIIKNSIVQKSFEQSIKEVKTYSSKVVETYSDDFERILILENKEMVSTKLVLAADGSGSHLRNLSSIKYIEHDLNSVAINGYLNVKKFSNYIARQAFLKEGPIGLLPVKFDKTYVNFVWSIKNNYYKKIITKENIQKFISNRLNQFYLDDGLLFSPIEIQKNKDLSIIKKWPLKLIYAPKPIGNRIALLGDASHNIHPLAGQGFNLSIEDCFQILDILIEAIQEGKDIGNLNNLTNYHSERNLRVKSMVIATSSLHYTFYNDSKILQKFLSFGMERLESKNLKNIFKNLVISF